jgi:hypothetical protein
LPGSPITALPSHTASMVGFPGRILTFCGHIACAGRRASSDEYRLAFG